MVDLENYLENLTNLELIEITNDLILNGKCKAFDIKNYTEKMLLQLHCQITLELSNRLHEITVENYEMSYKNDL
jgi:hypothetical protein